jgi:hypothetical protein
MNKPVNPIHVMVFMFLFSLVGILIYLYIVDKKAKEQQTFFETTVKVALEEGVNKDSIKNALVRSDTVK